MESTNAARVLDRPLPEPATWAVIVNRRARVAADASWSSVCDALRDWKRSATLHFPRRREEAAWMARRLVRDGAESTNAHRCSGAAPHTEPRNRTGLAVNPNAPIAMLRKLVSDPDSYATDQIAE